MLKMRTWKQTAGLGMALTASTFGQVLSASEEAERPNFLFILADDMGRTDAGVLGSDFYETPNIDRIASEGMNFTAGYATSPVCSPTRASIMSGKNPGRLNLTDWLGAAQPEDIPDIPDGKWYSFIKRLPLLPAPYTEQLPLEEVTIAESLQEAGYRTLYAGKWHLGEKPKHWPEHQGFDINKGGWMKGNPGKDYFSPYENPRLEDGPDGEHLPDRLANETVAFIRSNKEAPFLAYLSFYSPHTPLNTRADLEQKYIEKRQRLGLDGPEFGKEGDRKERIVHRHPVYAGMMESMDMAIGKVLDALKESGAYENTVIIFTSDNGGLSVGSGTPTANTPYRAGKGWIYEGGIREPFLIKWPGVTEPGSVSGEPVICTDFYPTMLEMAGLPLRPEQHKDGTSLAPLLKGEAFDRGPLYWHYPHYSPLGDTPASAIRDGKWKLIKRYENDRVELYNLAMDGLERSNVARHHPEVAAKLRRQLEDWLASVDARYPSPNPNAVTQ